MEADAVYRQRCNVLVYTSLLFGITVIHAAYKQNLVMVVLMTCLMGFSVIVHGKRFEEFQGKQVVHGLDVLFAHLMVTYVLFLNFYKPHHSIWTWLTYFAVAYVALVYLLWIKNDPKMQPLLHSSIHLMGVLGSNLVLI